MCCEQLCTCAFIYTWTRQLHSDIPPLIAALAAYTLCTHHNPTIAATLSLYEPTMMLLTSSAHTTAAAHSTPNNHTTNRVSASVQFNLCHYD